MVAFGASAGFLGRILGDLVRHADGIECAASQPARPVVLSYACCTFWYSMAAFAGVFECVAHSLTVEWR